MAGAQLEKFHVVQVSRSRESRDVRVGQNQVVELPGSLKEVPRVTPNHIYLLVLRCAVCEVVEIGDEGLTVSAMNYTTTGFDLWAYEADWGNAKFVSSDSTCDVDWFVVDT